MNNGITLNTALFDASMKQLVKELGLSTFDIFKDQMRLLIEKLYQFTPPATKSAGSKLVSSQLGHMFYGVDDEDTLLTIHAIASSKGDFKGSPPHRILVGADVNELSQIHTSHRDSRGRVYKSVTPYWVSMQTLNKLRTQVKKRVGRLKFGWASALQAFGSTKLQGWVRRAGGHSGVFGLSSGGHKITMNKSLTKGSMSGWNDTPYIRDIDGMTRRAEQVRLKGIKKHLKAVQNRSG